MEKHAVAEISLKDRAMQELSKVDAGIGLLKEQYGSKVYDCTKTLDMAQAKADRVTIREVRYQVPKIAEAVTKQLNNLKTDIKAEAERIIGELLEIEKVSDDAIKAEEERKAKEKEEKDRIAAEAQKVLDDKIIAIGKLPLTCIGKTIPEIKELLSRLEPHPIGAEFTGENRNRAEAAKTEALEAIREMLAGLVRAEEIAAQVKAEQEAEAIRQESERIAHEEANRIQREQMEALQAELAENKRLADIEEAARKEAAEAVAAELAKDRAAFEAEQAAARKAREDIDRVAKEAQAREESEKKRIQDEADAKKREEDRLAAVEAEKKQLEAEAAAKKAEKERKASEKAQRLALAKLGDATSALKKILAICEDHEQTDRYRIESISIIAEANIA